VSQIALIAAGGLVAAAGLWLLIVQRPNARERTAWMTSSKGNTRLSEPTRIALGVESLILGYHLVIWTFPSGLTVVQLDRKLWYVWVMIGLCGLGLSFWADRSDRKKISSDGDEDR
jgi:hypothetical protein